jgi:hypothetical protein
MHELDSLQGYLRKRKPPSFDGEREREYYVDAWILGLGRYFQLHNYSSNLEARISTYLRQDEEERYHKRRGNYRRDAHSRSVSIPHRHHSPLNKEILCI